MRRVITVANQKGGVGKTTTVANLGAALASLGYRIAVVDLDSQGALTVSLGFDPYRVTPSMTHVLLDNTLSLGQILCEAGERMKLGPAGADLLSAEYRLLRKPDRTARLKGAIERSKDEFDFVIVDTPPNLGLLTVNGLVASGQLLIPVKAEYLAMRGVRPLLESVWLIRERINPDLRLLGVLPTMYRRESAHAAAVVEEMRSVFKNKMFQTVIPLDEAAAVAPAARKTAVEYRPNSAVSAAYRRLAEEVSDVLR